VSLPEPNETGLRPQTDAAPRVRVLYVVYWGVAEPLGQSLVLPAVERMGRSGARLTLISFEKPADLANVAETSRIRDRLGAAGVVWRALRYHKRPKWPATLLDVLNAVRAGLAIRLQAPVDLVHARTFVGGVMGLVISGLLRVSLVYHNEGFYPDEQVDGGVWRQGSFAHRLAKRIERLLYSRAEGIVALSERARNEIRELPLVKCHGTPIIVVPSCVDLDLFPPPPPKAPWRAGDPLRLVYVGSIGGRYRFDKAGEFVAHCRRRLEAQLRVLTPTEPGRIAAILDAAGMPSASFSVARLPHAEMPAELARHDAGLFPFTRGLSEHGCSPTKIGEYWAAGLPVVVSPNVSDSEDIVCREGVGVILEDFNPAAYEAALDELLVLLQDPELGKRCRRAAEEHYALAPACGRQLALYERLAAGRDARTSS
jgi:glycosyltransferase involved in cell wall biosynthesis